MFDPSPRKYPDLQESALGFVLRSPAKINLSLRIVGKQDDGYHQLETIFQELDWADEIEFCESKEFNLTIQGADLPSDGRNLIVRAAVAFAEAAMVPCRGQLNLTKVLPLQGGVGGGSSNAAITLLGLNRLWQLNWDRHQLEPIARKLGADCPFFLYGGLATATGRGDVIEPLSGASGGHFVLVLPTFGVETAWAFSKVKFPLTEVEKNVIFSSLPSTGVGEKRALKLGRNDLENIVFQRFPELNDIRERLLELGACLSMMSGSGSTVFGLFEIDEDAQRAAHELSKNRSVRVKVCRAIARLR